jgi:poly-gamma-glutamate capsule biosynthesis protein CapA/YwtB (metallophosphatase superfamily)
MNCLLNYLRQSAALCVSVVMCLGAAMAQTPEPVVSVVFAGDIMLEGGPDRAIRRGQDPFAGVFRVHPRGLKFLQRHFDAVGLANNHSGDYGQQAFAQMLGLLKKSGLGYYGGGHNLKEAHTPLILERQGLRIALLGYDEFQPRNFEADHDRPGVAWSEDEQVVRDIADARRIWKADVVIPVMHWGWEEPISNARQRKLARLMIDAGADAVIGGHPHQLQDTEQYKGKPIFYSLGNFVFEGFPDKVNNLGWVVRLTIDRQGVRAWQAHDVHIDKQGLPHAGKQPRRVEILR